jgi:nucleoside-diphosphate-sugar epimerase
MKVCIVGASGKLGRYMVGHALARGYEVVGVCRAESVGKLDDQVEACRRIFASDTRWTAVRGSDLEEGESEGLPVWSRHVGDPVLASNRTRRTDFALFMVAALTDDALVHVAPAIVGCRTPSALVHAAAA